MAEKVRLINWGDGTFVEVKIPDLSSLPAVICPTACYPADGDDKMELGTKKKNVPTTLPCNDSVE